MMVMEWKWFNETLNVKKNKEEEKFPFFSLLSIDSMKSNLSHKEKVDLGKCGGGETDRLL